MSISLSFLRLDEMVSTRRPSAPLLDGRSLDWVHTLKKASSGGSLDAIPCVVFLSLPLSFPTISTPRLTPPFSLLSSARFLSALSASPTFYRSVTIFYLFSYGGVTRTSSKFRARRGTKPKSLRRPSSSSSSFTSEQNQETRSKQSKKSSKVGCS